MSSRKPEHDAFLTKLWEIQAGAGLNDLALAMRLGVNRSAISRLKSGQRGMGLRFAQAACAEFPALRFFLVGRLPKITDSVPVDKGVAS